MINVEPQHFDWDKFSDVFRKEKTKDQRQQDPHWENVRAAGALFFLLFQVGRWHQGSAPHQQMCGGCCSCTKAQHALTLLFKYNVNGACSVDYLIIPPLLFTFILKQPSKFHFISHFTGSIKVFICKLNLIKICQISLY